MMGRQSNAQTRYCTRHSSCTTEVPIEGIKITPTAQNLEENMASASQPSSSNAHGPPRESFSVVFGPQVSNMVSPHVTNPDIETMLSSGYSTYILEDNNFGEGTSSGSRRVSCKRRLTDDCAPSSWLTLGETLVETKATRAADPGSSRNVRPRSEESSREHLWPLQENNLNEVATMFSQNQENINNSNGQVNEVPMASPRHISRLGVPECYELDPTSNMTTYFNNILGGTTTSPVSSSVHSFRSSALPTFGDFFQSQDAGFQGLSNSDSMMNPAFHLPQGDRENHYFPRIPESLNFNNQNQYSIDHYDVFMPIFSSSNFGAAPGESQGPWTHDTNVLPNFQALVSNQMTNGGGGGSNPNVASGSNGVVPIQQRDGRLEIEYYNAWRLMGNYTDSSSESENTMGLGLIQGGTHHSLEPQNDVGVMQIANEPSPEVEEITESEFLNYVPEVAGDDEEVGDEDADEDEFEDLRFDVDDMSYEELLELEEEMGDVRVALNVIQIEKVVKRATHTNANADVSTPPDSCPICREDYADDDDIGKLDCGHDYHYECLKKWLQIKNNCPICKKRFSAMV